MRVTDILNLIFILKLWNLINIKSSLPVSKTENLFGGRYSYVFLKVRLFNNLWYYYYYSHYEKENNTELDFKIDNKEIWIFLDS